MRTTISRRLPILIAVLAAGLVAAPSAMAGGACDEAPSSQPFSRWLDRAGYVPVPGGSFEGSLDGWSFSGGAATVAGNEPWHVGGSGDSRSLSLASGASATTATTCGGLDHPTLRFFARRTGGGLLSALSTLRVDVLYRDSGSILRSLPVGLVAGTTSWAPTLPTLTLSGIPLLTADDLRDSAIAFRLTAQGGGWQVDDLYVDPYGRR
jgi:hypothetical protein